MRSYLRQKFLRILEFSKCRYGYGIVDDLRRNTTIDFKR